MKKLLIACLIVLAVAVMIFLNLNKSSDGSTATTASFGRGKAQEVKAKAIVKDTISSSILITGGVEEIDREEVISTTPLEISRVHVVKGQSVEKGDLLFDVNLASLEDELEQLTINYDIQQLTMEKLEALSMTSDVSGLEVAKDLAYLSLSSAQRFYDSQVETLEKNQTLFDSGIISKAELDGYKSSVTEAQSQLTTASLNYDRSKKDLASMSETNNNSERSSEIDIEIQQMNLDSLQMNISKLEDQIQDIEDLTYAPISGVVTNIEVKNGEMSSSMMPLMVITDVENLKVVANIREYDIRDLQLGQEVFITGDAIAKEEAVEAEVSYIAPIATQALVNGRQTTAIEIEMTVTKGVECLKPGYTTDCEIVTSRIDNAILASYEMLAEDEDGNDIVYVIVDSRVEERIVELGVTSDFDAQVLDGLEEGDVVVLNPSISLTDGTSVQVVNDLEEEGK